MGIKSADLEYDLFTVAKHSQSVSRSVITEGQLVNEAVSDTEHYKSMAE